MDFYNDIIFIDDKNSNDKGECIMDENQNMQDNQVAQNTNLNNANTYNQTTQQNTANNTNQKVKNSKPNKKEKLEKPKKKGKVGKVIAIIILLILVVAGGCLTGYLLTGGEFDFFDNNETSSSTNSSKKRDTDEEDDDKKSEDKDIDEKNEENSGNNTGSKIDKNKPWVYDANYAEGKQEKTVTTLEGTEYKTVDMLIAPYININSKAAKKANKEIKDVYNLCYEKYGKTVESGAANLYKIEYEYIVKDKLLSVVVKQHSGVTNGGSSTDYYTYNFNLSTYEEASLEDVCKVCGFSSEEDLEEKVKITLENGVSEGSLSNNSKWYNNQYYIDKNYNLNIINTEAPMGENGSLVIKPDVESVKKQDTSSIELPEDDGNEPPAGAYGDGIDQIRDNLKDANWIKNNVMMSKSVFGEAITGNQTLNFMKVIGGKYTPMFLVEARSESDMSNQVFIVSYQGGKVVVKPFTKYPLHNSHAGIEADPNKCIASVSYMHMGYFSETYYDLSSGRAKELIEIGGDDNDASGTTYYKRAANSSERTSISKSEYDSILSQYSKYKFYPIGTELNDANINEYVK